MMKNVKLRLAVIGVLGLVSSQVLAAGALSPLVAAPAGSAYINCYNTGRVIPVMPATTTALLARTNFGTNAIGAGAVAACAITGLANESTPPLAGYTLVVSASRPIPKVTGGVTTPASSTIGSVLDVVWRNAAKTSCIFGTRVSLTNVDHDSVLAGTQLFEVNDIARGGYSGSGTVNVGYFIQAANASPVYRAGRSFTSVQHRAYKYAGTLSEKQNNGTGYLDLPTIGGLSTLNINGVNSPITGAVVATIGGVATLQDAQINSNWVDFTTDAVFTDDDGATNPVSSMTYVEAACNADSVATINATWVKTGAISLRQSAQENTTFKEISISGYAPPGAVVP
jgi:hypothetical protein